MTFARLVVVVAISLLACSKKSESGATGSGSASPTSGSAAMTPTLSTNVSAQAAREAFVKKMETLADEMCACKSEACAVEVSERIVAWSADADKQANLASEKPSPEHEKRISVAATRYTDCTNAVINGTPTPPPAGNRE